MKQKIIFFDKYITKGLKVIVCYYQYFYSLLPNALMSSLSTVRQLTLDIHLNILSNYIYLQLFLQILEDLPLWHIA